MIDLEKLEITTTAHESFSGTESARMAFLIYKRFGYDLALAATKWRMLLGGSRWGGASDTKFQELAEVGRNVR